MREYTNPRHGWTHSGADLGGRVGRLTYSSEYHRLLAKERREPWTAFFIFCLVLLCFAGAVYFAASA